MLVHLNTDSQLKYQPNSQEKGADDEGNTNNNICCENEINSEQDEEQNRGQNEQRQQYARARRSLKNLAHCKFQKDMA